MLMCSFAGLVGYPGINEAGVSVFQNALSTRSWRGDAMPHYFMKRVLLEQADVAACAAVLGKARVCSSGNYVLTDRRGTLRDVELTPDRLAVLEAEDDIVVHANHFQSPTLVPEEALLPHIPDSAHRSHTTVNPVARGEIHTTCSVATAQLAIRPPGPRTSRSA